MVDSENMQNVRNKGCHQISNDQFQHIWNTRKIHVRQSGAFIPKSL